MKITGNVENGESIGGVVDRGTKRAQIFVAETREGKGIGGDGESD